MSDLEPSVKIPPECKTCRHESNKPTYMQYLDDETDYINKCNPKDGTYFLPPKVVKVADKVVETYPCRKQNRYDDTEELRERAFTLYKNYVAGRKEDGKCPTCVYIGPRGEKVLFKGDALENEQIYCEYDPSFNHFLSVAFMILFMMLLFTSGFIYVVSNTSSMKDLFRDFILFFAIPAAIIIFVLNVLLCYFEVSRMVPCNFLYVLISVVTYSIMAGVLTVLLDTTIIFFMFAATTVVIIFWILLAFSQYNFREWSLYMYTIFVEIVAVITLVFIFRTFTKLRYGIVQFFVALCCTMLYDVIMVMNLQMILSGKTMELDETDFAVVAILLYTSVVELFWSSVQVAGLFDKCGKCG